MKTKLAFLCALLGAANTQVEAKAGYRNTVNVVFNTMVNHATTAVTNGTETNDSYGDYKPTAGANGAPSTNSYVKFNDVQTTPKVATPANNTSGAAQGAFEAMKDANGPAGNLFYYKKIAKPADAEKAGLIPTTTAYAGSTATTYSTNPNVGTGPVFDIARVNLSGNEKQVASSSANMDFSTLSSFSAASHFGISGALQYDFYLAGLTGASDKGCFFIRPMAEIGSIWTEQFASVGANGTHNNFYVSAFTIADGGATVTTQNTPSATNSVVLEAGTYAYIDPYTQQQEYTTPTIAQGAQLKMNFFWSAMCGLGYRIGDLKMYVGAGVQMTRTQLYLAAPTGDQQAGLTSVYANATDSSTLATAVTTPTSGSLISLLAPALPEASDDEGVETLYVTGFKMIMGADFMVTDNVSVGFFVSNVVNAKRAFAVEDQVVSLAVAGAPKAAAAASGTTAAAADATKTEETEAQDVTQNVSLEIAPNLFTLGLSLGVTIPLGGADNCDTPMAQ